MPDYNPDREGHRDHKWIVHKAIRGNAQFNKIHAAGKDMPFNREGRFMVSDEKVASEIRQKYPRAATVTRVNTPHSADRGHKYFFRCPEMPWKVKDAEKEEEVD